jgi:hypothetical protein
LRFLVLYVVIQHLRERIRGQQTTAPGKPAAAGAAAY